MLRRGRRPPRAKDFLFIVSTQLKFTATLLQISRPDLWPVKRSLKQKFPDDELLSSHITDTRQAPPTITAKSNKNNGKHFPERSTGLGPSRIYPP
jgi:hypothetical protein